eukprot:9260287-Karenia_brevis.AAC.1
MGSRKHMVQQAGAVAGVVGISISEAAAVSDGPPPYNAPGISLPFDGLNTSEAPQGLQTRGVQKSAG